MSNEESIGKRIKRLRKECGITQGELADRVGVSPQAVSKWENEYSCPDISILPALAKVFGISTDELLSGETKGEAALHGEFIEDPDRAAKPEHDVRKKHRKQYRYRNFEFSTVFPDKFWYGIFIVAVGAMLILKNATNIIPWGFWSIIWPTALICFGMSEVCKRVSVFNVSVTLVGIYILLCNTDVIPSSFSGKWFVVGLLLIVCGISAIFPKTKRIWSKKFHNNTGTRELHCENGYINYDGSFCSDKASFNGGVLHGGRIESLFGSFIIDFTPLTMVGEDAVLNVEVSFASIIMILPRTVRITDKRDVTFGSVTIKGWADDNAPYNLTISSDVSFGSLEIRYV